MKTPTISVIVPVYNVEPYLRKCLDSIVNQTYRNLEIILVDDGSPDNCGAVCDEYAASDSRIKVIHKENGGVSSARNAGLAAATGEWIGWVDADDWIEPDMYGYMLDKVREYSADIAVCSRFEQYRGQCVFRGWEREQGLDTECALELLLKNDAMQNFLWDKLWRRELFDGVVFPEGRTFEDIAVMHRLFMRARRVACLPEAKYFYLQHSGSIVDNKSLENRINYFRAARLRLDEMGGQWPQFRQLMEAQCAASAVSVWCSVCANPKAERQEFMPELKEISKFAKEHYRAALRHMSLGVTGRCVLRLTPYPAWWAFALARFFSWVYSLKHGRAL